MMFKSKGCIDLMFLKHYSCCLDKKTNRATHLKGSFSKEKEYSHLKKMKAKTKATEILWVFFGIHTTNALEIGRRIQHSQAQIVA